MQDHLDPEEESLSIKAELHQLEDIAREVSSKRVELLRRLDALQSKTRVLPPETLSLIFQYTIKLRKIRTLSNGLLIRETMEEEQLSPISLGSICHAWRQVTWSTPQLWAELSFALFPKAEKIASLLDLYLCNVRGLPLKLCVAFNRQCTYDFEDDPVAQVFFREESLRKFGVLNFSNPPASWLRRFNVPFPQLAEVHFCGGGVGLSERTGILENAPNLRKISLGRMYPPPDAPWSSITVLVLGDIPAATALQCLLKSPNLVKFHYRMMHSRLMFSDDGGGVDEEPEGPPEISNVLTLPRLEILMWSFKLNQASNLFLHRIRLPALHTLFWFQRGLPLDNNIFYTGANVFFENLSSSPLTNLQLEAMPSLDIALAKHIYHKNPQVENLTLNCCEEEGLCVALASLVPGWNGGGQTDERRYLVNLKVLEIKVSAPDVAYSVPELLGESFGDFIADLLIGRASADPDSSLCININFNKKTKIAWKPETKERLRAFNWAGSGVRLLEDGGRIDWL